ncbi:MAG: TolC family protein, partial [Bacteroidales bacterium]|nr:TolC family protein [Bacteroidales bacterium]
IISLIASLWAFGAEAQEILTLAQCQQKALESNRELRNSALEIQWAGEQKKEAFTNYFPKISANVMAFQMFDKLIKSDGTFPEEIGMLGENFYPMIGQPYSLHEFNKMASASLSLIQPIYNGGQIRNGNRLAQIQQDVAYLKNSLTERDVIQKVTENYWQIATIKYNLRTIDAADKQLDNVLAQVENYVNAGVTTRNSLLKVKLQKQDLASNRLKLENARRVLLMLLSKQIGLANQEIDIDDSAIEEIDQPVEADIQQALHNREEIKMAEIGLEAQKLQIKMERGKQLPSVAVGAMGFHSRMGGISDQSSQLMDTKTTNGMVFGTVNIPISDWWSGSKAVSRQKIKLQQAENQLADAQEGITIEIESLWNNVVESYSQIEIARANVEEAEESLRISTECYKNGTETLSDLLDAETLHRKAQDQLATALATYQIHWDNYKRKTK